MAELAVKDMMNVEWLRPLERALHAEESRKEMNLTPQERKNREGVDAYIGVLWGEVQDSILSALNGKGFKRFTSDHFKRDHNLAENLRHGLPIGAAKDLPDDEIRQRLFEGDLYREGIDHGERYNLLREVPVNPGEVLTAAWLFEIDRTPEIIRAAFAKNTGDEVFDVVKSFVVSSDDLLLTSIEFISILEKIHGTAGC